MAMSDEAKIARRFYQKKWREENRDKISEYHEEWRKKHPDKIRQYNESYWERQAQKMG